MVNNMLNGFVVWLTCCTHACASAVPWFPRKINELDRSVSQVNTQLYLRKTVFNAVSNV